jgi:hypothetical protein
LKQNWIAIIYLQEIVKFKKQFIKEHTQRFNIYLLLFALVPSATPHLPIMVMASPFTIASIS